MEELEELVAFLVKIGIVSLHFCEIIGTHLAVGMLIFLAIDEFIQMLEKSRDIKRKHVIFRIASGIKGKLVKAPVK